MNNKIIGVLGLCLKLSLNMVSAMEINYKDYDKKDNIITFEAVLNNECVQVNVKIFDKNDSLIGGNISRAISLCVFWSRPSRGVPPTIIRDDRRTGTFDYKYDLDLISRKHIKGLGKLRYEISTIVKGRVLAEGRLK